MLHISYTDYNLLDQSRTEEAIEGLVLRYPKQRAVGVYQNWMQKDTLERVYRRRGRE